MTIIKRIAIIGLGVAGVGLFIVGTPWGVEAQQTIRNITVLAMPADATELPSAAALADNTANPTVPGVASFSMCWDGATWDRCAAAGSTDTELPAASALADNTANPTTTGVAAFNMCWDGTNWDRCTGAGADTELPSASALADNTANPTVPGIGAFLMCFDGSTWDRCPSSSGGTGVADANTSRMVPAQQTPYKSIDLDETEEQIKATAGEVCSVWVTNTATATRWLKFYNATAASVTVGTTTPVITVGIPGNATDDVSGSFATANGCLAFDTAISIAATTAVADNDAGAPGTNDVIVMVGYR